MKEPEVVHVSEFANTIEKYMLTLDLPERIRIATSVLLDLSIENGSGFKMRVETNDGTFTVTVRKEDE